MTRFLSGLVTAATLCCAFYPATPLVSQAAPAASATASKPLPADPAIRTGTLSNGMRYIVRQNAWPVARAELRLVVNAGSVLEDESQRGLAHMLEHMAFNGTTHFPENKLVSYLQSIGMSFGADLNAYTSFDETVYMLTVPTDSAKFLDTGLEVLSDWANEITLDPKEVEDERGVVIEEWRGRRGAGARMLDQQISVVFAGAKYGERLPIGLTKVLQTAPKSELKRFYDEWYRPDLMSVVVVGDIDADAVIKQIEQRFGGIKPRLANPRPRTKIDLPATGDTVLVLSDPELTNTSADILFRQPTNKTMTTADLRHDIAVGLFASIVNQRLSEIALKPDAPFMSAGTGWSGLTRDAGAFTVRVSTKDNALEPGIQAVMAELERVKQFGITESELDRQKKVVLKSAQDAYERRKKVKSADYAKSYVGMLLSGEPAISSEEYLKQVEAILPTITAADVSKFAGEFVTDKNRAMIASMPKRADVKEPTMASLTAAYKAGQAEKLTAYSEEVSTAPLLDPLPKPGKIVSEKTDAATGIVTYTLSNGIKVNFKRTDFAPDQVLMQGSRDGGMSLAPDDMVVHAMFADQIVQAGGVGQLDPINLRKRLAGKSMRVGADIGGFSESLVALATTRDFRSAVELAYLRVTQPRLDSNVVKKALDDAKTALANKSSDPEAVYGDTVSAVMSRYSKRSPIITSATFTQIDPKKAFAFYKQRFADMGGFVFTVVGDISADSLKPILEQYLGSLPTTNAKHTYNINNYVEAPSGVTKREVHQGQEPKSRTDVFFYGPTEISSKNFAKIAALREALQIRMTNVLREKLGGTYSPSIGGGLGIEPKQRYSVRAVFTADPERLPKLQAALFEEFEKFKKDGPTADELAKVKEESRRKFETNQKENGYWLGIIPLYEKLGWNFADILKGDDELQKLTIEDVRDAARTFLNSSQYAQFSLFPATSTTPSTSSSTPASGASSAK